MTDVKEVYEYLQDSSHVMAWATDQNQIWVFGVRLGVQSQRNLVPLLSRHSCACQSLPSLGTARSRTQGQRPPLHTWAQSSISTVQKIIQHFILSILQKLLLNLNRTTYVPQCYFKTNYLLQISSKLSEY